MASFRFTNGAGTNIIAKVPIESIEITEVGPGGVSSMSFTIDDIAKTESVAKWERFLLIEDSGADFNVFRGFATEVTARPYGIGRQIDVECVGPEALLDWLVAPAKTILAATNFPQALASIVTAKTSAFNTTVASGIRTGNLAGPIGDWIHPTYGGTPFLTGGVNFTIPAGTLRQQIERLHEMSAYDNAGAKVPFGSLLTVDHSLGIRSWEDAAGLQPTDWTTLAVVDTVAGTFVTSGLKHTTDYLSTYDKVYVVGTGVTGFVGAAGAVPAHDSLLVDADIDSANERDVAGGNFLLAHGTTARGSFRLENWDPSLNYHAGGLLTLTDANVGISAVTYRISEIRKTFQTTGKQDWEIFYGGPAPSLARSVRAATRGQF